MFVIIIVSGAAYERVAMAATDSLVSTGEPFCNWGAESSLPSPSKEVAKLRVLEKRSPVRPEDYGANHPQREVTGGARCVCF